MLMVTIRGVMIHDISMHHDSDCHDRSIALVKALFSIQKY